MTSPRDILEFWFSDAIEPYWFRASDDIDAQIRHRFAPVWRQAEAGAMDSWANGADGALALIILLDQFPRNMFRHTPDMYRSDAKALAVCEASIDRGFDRDLPMVRRRFLYLPLMHAEDLRCQHRCVDLFSQWDDDPQALESAHKHKRIIERFGRYPHRNAILGRPSSDQETEFLTGPDSSF